MCCWDGPPKAIHLFAHETESYLCQEYDWGYWQFCPPLVSHKSISAILVCSRCWHVAIKIQYGRCLKPLGPSNTRLQESLHAFISSMCSGIVNGNSTVPMASLCIAGASLPIIPEPILHPDWKGFHIKCCFLWISLCSCAATFRGPTWQPCPTC